MGVVRNCDLEELHLSVIAWESVPEVGNGGQPISMKLAAEVSLDEIFQKPIWFCFLTFGWKVSGEVPFGAFNSLKILFFKE